jgi:hypothetical protein
LRKHRRRGEELFGGVPNRGPGFVAQDPLGVRGFCLVHAVLPYVRRQEFLAVLQELRRIQRLDGIGSHRIPIRDITGGNLNDLRFGTQVWESSFMANSRFYTNRLRYLELLQLFRITGFEPEVVRTVRWKTLPTPRRKMANEFALLSEEDLQVVSLTFCSAEDAPLGPLVSRPKADVGTFAGSVEPLECCKKRRALTYPRSRDSLNFNFLATSVAGLHLKNKTS